ncbi:MAG: hypothetical protein H6807_15985 [Planctomycetes bacterium]|nr:hypothetical protein [Planctomycetota bacterium]
MTGKRLAIVREWKTELERRCPLVPATVRELVAAGIEVLVEPSPVRIHGDQEFVAAGARLVDDPGQADFLLGIKEMPIEKIQAGKPHLFFSHTIKQQPYNMPLLRQVLDRGATLLDYELVTDERGRRMVFFGRQAGQAGMINTLWTLGQRLLALGIANPFDQLRQARRYDSLAEALAAVAAAGRRVADEGLPAIIDPLVIGITGTGNVSGGAQEVLAILEPERITAEELLRGDATAGADRIRYVVFDEASMVRRRDGGAFVLQEYYDRPEFYEGRFADYLPFLGALVVGNYWDPRYPRLVTRADVAELCRPGGEPSLLVIGDVSCDPEGGVEVTLEPTLPDAPSYVYSPASESISSGFEGEGLAIMACEILPTELPRDSSRVFSEALQPFLPALLAADWSQTLDRLDLPGPFQRAVIAHQGRLAPRWAHLL